MNGVKRVFVMLHLNFREARCSVFHERAQRGLAYGMKV
jgi:hypothetical protein